MICCYFGHVVVLLPIVHMILCFMRYRIDNNIMIKGKFVLKKFMVGGGVKDLFACRKLYLQKTEDIRLNPTQSPCMIMYYV